MSLALRLLPLSRRQLTLSPLPHPRFLHQSIKPQTRPPKSHADDRDKRDKKKTNRDPILHKTRSVPPNARNSNSVILHHLSANRRDQSQFESQSQSQSQSQSSDRDRESTDRTAKSKYYYHRYNNMDDNNDSDVTPHKQLLMDAAAEIRSDQLQREKSKPQNAGEGTVRLLGDSLGGVALGAAAVVMGPIQGYKQSGPKGIVGGVLGGLAVGVATTTVGIGSGITHFVQGTSKSVSNLHPKKIEQRLVVDVEHYPQPTPSSAPASASTSQADQQSQGDVMPDNDPQHFHRQASYTNPNVPPPKTPLGASAEEVKKVYLEERKRLYGELMAQHTAESAAASMDGLTPPVDMSLYDELQVDSDATPAQIRKAYYRMAQLYHPDKHPNDPEATARFQKISNAYQVLSDPVKREEYHRVGESATSSDTMMDPKTLFVLMFADFEHIVGDLATATILMGGQGDEEKEGNTNSTPTTDGSGTASGSTPETDAAKRAEERRQMRERKRAQFQKLREEQLVKLLEKRFQPWLDGNDVAFIEHAKHEVRYLREQPFGRDCLKTTGYIYAKRAKKVLDSKGMITGFANFFEDIGDKAHSFKSKIRALEGGIKAITVNERAEENETIDAAARREAVATLGAVWLSSVVDIESTLRKVVTKFLKPDDKSPGNKENMKRKAQGLIVLSKIFDQA